MKQKVNVKSVDDLRLPNSGDRGKGLRTAAVIIREPERKKEQDKRRPAGKLSPWS